MDALLRRRAMIAAGGGSPTPPGPTPTQVSWLCNNTLGEYIDLGIKPDNTTIVEVTYQDFIGVSGVMFGSRVAGNNAMYAFGSHAATTVRADCMSKTYSSNTGLGSHTVRLSNASCKIDGSNIAVFNPLFTGNNYNIFVFALNNGGTPVMMLNSVKISSIKVRKGGVYVLDLTPAVINGEGVFVDSIGGTVFYNQGTGAFTWQ